MESIDREPRVRIYKSGVFSSDQTEEAQKLEEFDCVEQLTVPGAPGEKPEFMENGTLISSSVDAA